MAALFMRLPMFFTRMPMFFYKDARAFFAERHKINEGGDTFFWA
jgi:hypothetical protein